jgi:hypothetical protein
LTPELEPVSIANWIEQIVIAVLPSPVTFEDNRCAVPEIESLVSVSLSAVVAFFDQKLDSEFHNHCFEPLGACQKFLNQCSLIPWIPALTHLMRIATRTLLG